MSMAVLIQAVTDRPVRGNIALRAYKTDLNVKGGNPIAIYKVTNSELIENGGHFKVAGNSPHQFLVHEVTDGSPLGGSAIPLYIINDTIPPTPECNLDPEYCNVEEFMAVIPSNSWRNAASQLFIDLRNALGITSLSEAFEVLHLYAAETEQVALLNMANPTVNDAVNNGATFTANVGFTGNGTSAYIDSSFSPLNDATITSIDNMAIGIRIVTNSEGDVTDFGTRTSSTNEAIRLSSYLSTFDFMLGGVNSGNSTLFVASTDSRGLWVLDRSGNLASAAYRNGVSIITSNINSTNLSPHNILVAANNSNGVPAEFSPRQYSLFFVTRSLTATEHEDILVAFTTFLTEVGALELYEETLRNTFSASEVWPLTYSNVSVIPALVNASQNGSYQGWDTQSILGPSPGFLSPFSDGSNDYGDIWSPDLENIFDGAVGSAIIWAKVNSAAVWTDNAVRYLLFMQRNVQNNISILKSTDNALKFRYRAGNVLKEVSTAFTGTGWFMVGMSWDKPADQFKAFVNGVQVGSTQTALGTFTAGLNEFIIGAVSIAPAQVWHGYLDYVAVRFGSIWTPTNFAGIASP